MYNGNNNNNNNKSKSHNYNDEQCSIMAYNDIVLWVRLQTRR